jgi:hypothetical protein
MSLIPALAMQSVTQFIDRCNVGWLVNEELENMWNKLSMTSLEVQLRYFPDRSVESHESPL